MARADQLSRLSPRNRRRAAAAVGLAVLVHAVALLGHGGGALAVGAGAGMERAASVRVTMVPARSDEGPGQAAGTQAVAQGAAPSSDAATIAAEARGASTVAADLPVAIAASAPAPATVVADAAADATSGREAAPTPTPAGLRPQDVVDGYVLRRALSAAPVPRDEPPLRWPSGWIPNGRQSGVYTLFIDERGKVRRMVIDGPTLAPLLDVAAQQAFRSVDFEPGRVGDQAVKSMIRIEVTFDDTTPAAGSGPTVVSQRPL